LLFNILKILRKKPLYLCIKIRQTSKKAPAPFHRIERSRPEGAERPNLRPITPVLAADDYIRFKKGNDRMVKKAKVGDIIEFKNGLRGIVEKVNENSVIVDLTYMKNYRELDLQERTVVNHKNYKIIE
jgi:uncharacterized protein YkvS